MKSNMLEYKGYHTKIEVNTETLTLRGKIEGINDFVDFESKDISSIEKEFHNAVDDYLEFCEEIGKDPEKEYRGLFNVRISPDLHKRLALKAYANGDSLNCTVEKAICAYLTKTSESSIQLENSIKVLANMLEAKRMSPGQIHIESGSNIVPFAPSNINMIYREEVK